MRKTRAGGFAALFVALVLVASHISPEFGQLVVALLSLAGVELNPAAIHLPDFVILTELEGLKGMIGDVIFGIVAGIAIAVGVEKSYNHFWA